MTALDWSKHKIGPLAPCRYCRRKALMRDDQDRPAHKVCAENRNASTPAATAERAATL